MEYITHSEKETKNLAKDLAKKISFGVITLSGDLGAGKTTFVQGFAQGLGIEEKIISPTFVLIRQHLIPKLKKVLYHIDLYRLEEIKDLNTIGLNEIISDENNIVLIEWAEKILSLLPNNIIKINIEKIDQNSRKITISNLPF